MFNNYEEMGIELDENFDKNNMFLRLTLNICVGLLLLMALSTEAISNIKSVMKSSKKESSQIV